MGDVREIIGDEENLVVERNGRSQIVAEQKVIQDSRANSFKTFLWWKTSLFEEGRILTAAICSCVLILVVMLAGIYYLPATKAVRAERFRQVETTRLYSSGNISKIAVSPDGQSVAFVEKNNAGYVLFVKQFNSQRHLN